MIRNKKTAFKLFFCDMRMEGIEPSTSVLSGQRSAIELHAHNFNLIFYNKQKRPIVQLHNRSLIYYLAIRLAKSAPGGKLKYHNNLIFLDEKVCRNEVELLLLLF